VYCQLEALRHCLAPSLRRTLEELPKTLHETYERVLREIYEKNRESVGRLLQCLTVAVRPLRIEELAEILAIDFDALAHGGIPQLNTKWRWADQHEAVLSACSSLVTIVDNGDFEVVLFSHFSVKEFLTSDQLAHASEDVSRYYIPLEPAHTIFTRACLGVLLQLDDKNNVDGIPLVEYAARGFPLVEYATRHWVYHAQLGSITSCIQDAMKYFLDADKPHWKAWSRAQMIDASWGSFTPPEDLPDASPLYYASLGGFYDLVEHLVGKNPEHINARGGRMLTPLVAALRGKHFQIAELLHRHGADVDVRGNWENTPLREACQAEALDVVEWLLNHGADANTRDYNCWTPLHDAARLGRLQVLRMLIEHDANIHLQNNLGELPLHLAASPSNQRDQLDIMQSLLDHGADPNATDHDGSTPLHGSSWREKQGYATPSMGTVEGTRLLIKHGGIIDAEDNEGMTPLQLALEHGRDDISSCLMEHGAIPIDFRTDE
jgi:ankyrin repeat protein